MGPCRGAQSDQLSAMGARPLWSITESDASCVDLACGIPHASNASRICPGRTESNQLRRSAEIVSA